MSTDSPRRSATIEPGDRRGLGWHILRTAELARARRDASALRRWSATTEALPDWPTAEGFAVPARD